MRKLTLNLSPSDKNAVLLLNPSSFIWQSKYKRCNLRSSWAPALLPPTHPLRLAARSAAPARLVHQGQLPSSSLGVSANVSRRSLSRTSGPACLPSTRLPPADPATQPAFARTCTNTEHCTTAPSRPLASAYDPAAQQPAQGSTMQAGAVGGVGGLGGRWRCSSGPRYLKRPSPFVVSQGRSVGWARARGAPPRERTGRRPCDNPKGLEPRRWPCTRGARQSSGGRRPERHNKQQR